MRAYKRFGKEGFTLVELMIVVAIIGVLAALAIYGVRRYLASAKTSEAKNNVGAISRAAAAAYDREIAPHELLAEGASSSLASNALCASAAKAVPDGAPPQGRKYQPDSSAGKDFEDGSTTVGWKCLRFSVNQPIYYQLHYTVDAMKSPATAPTGTPYFEAAAAGDIDSDGVSSWFARTGEVNATTKTVRVATQIFESDPFE